ncbi:MAG: hypothetical protein JO270_11105 [Acidobacteriaceae bacterium]|nr:hypothetical protein [Acidobacteriaceae bacterium]
MNRRLVLICTLALQVVASAMLADTPPPSVDSVLEQYIKAAGGKVAIDQIHSREVQAREHRGPKLVYLWLKPDKVLLEQDKQKTGYDGGSGWILTKKKKLMRLPKGAQRPLEQDANPLRYVHLKTLYSEINPAPPETIDSRKMDVLVAPNELGVTKFYFDAATHLLARIDEIGETSAYYKHGTDFLDYQNVDGIQFPFRIVHRSTEPGSRDQEIRVSKVLQNIEIKPTIFQKPSGVAVTLGGKR